jgi:hypothetical protein
MNKAKWMLPIIVAVLTMGVLATGFAMPPMEGSLHGFVGKVTVADVDGNGAGTFSIQTLKGDQVDFTLLVDEQGFLYRFKAPGRAEDEAVPATLLQPEVTVAVLAQWTGTGYEALQVLVKPDRPAMPITGAVVEVDEETRTITITTAAGEQHTFTLPEDMEIPPMGEVVTVFLGPGEGEVEGVKVRDLVRGLVKASQIRERLEKHLEEVTGDEGEADDEAGVKARLAERLRNMVQQHSERQIQTLERVQERASERAREAIEKAKQNVIQNRERLQQVIDNAQTRIDALRERWQQWKASATATPRGMGPNR